MEADNGPTNVAALPAAVATDELQINTVDGSGDAKQQSDVTVVVVTSPSSGIKSATEKVVAENSIEPQISTTDSTDAAEATVAETTTEATVPVADSNSTVASVAEAMEVEDSSSNDIEMQDLSRDDGSASIVEAAESNAVTEAEVETPTTTTEKLDTIVETVDEPDSKVANSVATAPVVVSADATADVTTEPVVESSVEYQDVEKNISSLFNGDESVEISSSSSAVTTAPVSDKTDVVKTEEKLVTVEAVEHALNNGVANNDAESAAKSSDESAKELVSILEDVPAAKEENAKPTSTIVVAEAVDTASTNSTIQDTPAAVADTSAIRDTVADVIDAGTTAAATSASVTPDANSKCNGLEGGRVDSAKSTVPSLISSSADEHSYEVSIWYNENDLLCFSGERIDVKSPPAAAPSQASDPTEKVTSSVSSASSSLPEQFSLPTRMAAAVDSPQSQTRKIKQTITGTVELCKFVIEHFQKLGRSFSNDNAFATGVTDHTPVSGRRGTGRASATATSTTPATPKDGLSTPTTGGNKRKRNEHTTTAVGDDDEPRAASSAKKSKKDAPTTPVTPAADAYPEKVVLARWVDKKYYAGRVIEKKSNQKFVVLFEDGAKKVLPVDNIVFGDADTLPLLNEHVHALVNDDTYEPGTVLAVERKGETVCYTVQCESTIVVTVTGSDIYLEEEQAKIILAKQDVSILNEPEPGSSGISSTRKDRRQKRGKGRRTASDINDTEFNESIDLDSTPTSPKQCTATEAIVLVHGVQPELQITHEESKCDQLRFLIETFGQDYRTADLDPILGPIQECSLFRNKGFLLTCTIPIKSVANAAHTDNNQYDLSNKTMHFSTMPFFKEHIRNQIEAAGGTVYNHFEDIPKNRHRTTVLLAPFPCLTAAYIQCLASNIPAMSHEWLIKCCETNSLVKKDEYTLPSGWSIIDTSYRLWSTGAGKHKQLKRKSNTPFNKTIIIITSQQDDFAMFWSRVCQAAGAKIRTIKSKTDFTSTLHGYILMDDEFPSEYRAMAIDYNIPVVSTVWVVQSLIIGQVCDPSQHELLTQLYDDENL